MKKIFALIILTLFISKLDFAQVWSDDLFGIDSLWNYYGADAIVREMYNHNDTILYIGGSVRCVNSEIVNDIFSWNTNSVLSYEDGVGVGYVASIINYHDSIFIGGTFHSASDNPNTARLAVWNGDSWQSPSIGQADADVRDFCNYNDTLFIVGEFGHIGSLECDKISAYTGEEWINVGSFGMYARALEVFNGELYAGGYWGVRRYLGGTEWETFDIVPNGQINELTVDSINSFLFVGGQITQIDGEDSWGSAVWDGFNWTPMGFFYGKEEKKN
jgi:hypothetical protein